MPAKAQAERRRRLLTGLTVAVAALAVLLLALTSMRSLIAASGLQARLDRSYALQAARQRVVETLANAGSAGLQDCLSEILTERWGFTTLSISRRDGRQLASSSREQPLLDTLTRLLGTASGNRHSGQIAIGSAQLPGATLDYAMDAADQHLVHDAAVERLRGFGLIGLALALPFSAALLLLLRLSSRTAPEAEPLSRITPLPLRAQKPSASAPSSAPTASLPQDFGDTLDSLNLACIFVDADLQVHQLNDLAARLTGWSQADARSQLIYSVFRCSDPSGAPTTSPVERCLRGGQNVAPEELRLKPRGENSAECIIEASASAHRLADGRDGALMIFSDIGARVSGRDDLRDQAVLAATVLDQLGQGVLTTDAGGAIKTANLRLQRMYGYTIDELRRMTISRLLPVPFMNTPGIKLLDYANPSAARMPKVAGWRKDATTFPAEISVKPIEVAGESRIVVVVSDISERQRSASLAQRLGRLLEHSNEEIYIFDTQSLYFVEVNSGARRNLGMSADDLSRMSIFSIAQGLDANVLEGYLTKLRGGDAEHFTYFARHRRADTSTYPVEVRLSFSREEEPPVFMAIAQDITEREASEKRMRQLAHYDILTGLPNRALLFDRLKQSVIAADRTQRNLAVFFLDLNGFKPINDNFGHDGGDEVLKQVAARISEGLRAGDTVARLGGDEFVVLAEGLGDFNDVAALAWKIIELFEIPFDVKGTSQRLSSSLGITVYPKDQSEPEALLRHADAAMYQSKQAGPGHFHFYEGVAEAAAEITLEPRRNLAREIEPSLAAGQFQCELWPIFSADNQLLTASVADFHWSHPAHGRINSTETLQVARRSGLNVQLERWLLKQIVRQYHHAEKIGIPLIPVIVNLSGRQWRDPEFADFALSLLHESNCPAQGLLLGINAADWGDAAGAVQMLWPRLLEAGVRLALREPDLSQTLESVSVIVLPPSFAERVAEDVAVVERIRAYAATGLTVVAEGVATRQQRDRLQVLGCQLCAGPLSGGPYTPVEFASWFGVRKVKAL